MDLPRARVLYIPTETESSVERASRRALVQLYQAELIEAVRVFSLNRQIDFLGREEALDRLHSAITKTKPNVVILHHPGRTQLTRPEIAKIRSLGSFRFIYHEADPYHRVRNPLPQAARAAASLADVVYTHGAGSFKQLFVKAGARDVRWVPASIDPRDIPFELPRPNQELDVVMIANNGIAANPLRGHPGAYGRARLVDLLGRRFGTRFRVYGNGWKGRSAAGPVPWEEQFSVLREAKVSINWDHYPREPLYFSNRLPISLAAGSVHFTTRHPEYEKLFGRGAEFLRFGESPRALVTEVENFLANTTEQDLNELRSDARAFSIENLRRDDVMAHMIREAGYRIDSDAQRSAWELDVAFLSSDGGENDVDRT